VTAPTVAGYPWFCGRSPVVSRPSAPPRVIASVALVGSTPGSCWARNNRASSTKPRIAAALGIKRLNNFIDKSKLPIYERFATYSQIFSLNDIKNVATDEVLDTFDKDIPYKTVRNTFQHFKGKDLKDAGLKFDLMYFLPDQLLAKVDIASMHYGLEGRSPILDHKMIELACKIPFRLKVKNGETKYIFKKALESIVPKENLYRKKVGFGIPLNEWFKGDLNPYARKLLLSKNSLIKEFVHQEKIKPMINSNNQTIDFGPRIWSLMMLELWLQSYFS
jgi:asparagine synthase (glutamine-hydrolysing)